MFELCIGDKISSAHFLPGYEGRCKNIHGHTWKIEIFLRGKKLDDLGMIVDFAILKKQVKDFLEHIDHIHLNDLKYFQENSPTAENIAKYIYDNFSRIIAPVILEKVNVWESEQAYVSYFEEDS